MISLQELRTLTRKELLQELEKARKELQKTRIGVRTKHLKDTSEVKKLRRVVAHIHTTLKELSLEEIVSTAKQID